MNLHREQIDSEGTNPSLSASVLALALVAKHHGLRVDPNHVLKENGGRPAATMASGLILCAESIGLRAQGLRPGMKGIKNLANAFPALAFTRDNGVLVLWRVESSGRGDLLIVEDPLLSDVNQTFALRLDQFREIWNGDLVLFQKGLSHIKDDQDFSILFVISLIMREKKIALDIALSAIMLSLLALSPIMFWRLMSERVLPYHANQTFAVLCIVMSLVVVFETVFGSIRRILLVHLTTKVDIKLTTNMFNRVLRLPVQYFEQTPAGLTMYKMNQIGRVRQFLIGQLFGTVLDAGILVFFLPVMFLFSPILTSIVLGFGAAICGWILMLLPAYRRRSSAVEGAEAARGAFLAQSIQGIRTVKSLALEDKQMREWDSLTAEVARLKFREARLSSLVQAGVTPLERLMVSGSFAFGVYLALNSTDASFVGTLFAFLMLSQRLASPLIQASQLISQYDEARLAINVVAGLVNQKSEANVDGFGLRKELQGHIEFSQVEFSYKGASKPALKRISFEIPTGTTLGVMGRSGSGKTTITRLLQRLNTDYSGLVKVDGVDVRNYDLTHFRSSLGVVLQENFLFSGTIRSNITMAKPDATFDEMVHAARLAGAEEFIDKLPAGYETYVYEGSPNLSGGQRQRLAIARALITDPKILILDEATSALDAESEAIVNANIERISQGRTVITISHRLASLVKADAILVMEQGEVNDIGKHEELLERNEIYAHLWYTQNPHTAPSAAAAPGPRPQLTYRSPQNAA